MSKSLIPLLVIAAGIAVNYFVQRDRVATFSYRCGKCGSLFSLSALTATLAPHRFGQKWVRCPRCDSFSWATPER